MQFTLFAEIRRIQQNDLPGGRSSGAKVYPDYYFCKRNLRKYKKVYSKIAMGYYAPPVLKCDQK
jgi:hypothetical protein